MKPIHGIYLILILSVALMFKSLPEQNPEDLMIAIMGAMGAVLVGLWPESENEKQ